MMHDFRKRAIAGERTLTAARAKTKDFTPDLIKATCVLLRVPHRHPQTPDTKCAWKSSS